MKVALSAWAQDTANDPLKCLLWGTSLVAFVLMAFSENLHAELMALCISASPSLLAEASVYVRFYYASLDMVAFSGAVGLMLVAMMLPSLQGPLLSLWHQSRPYCGAPVIGLFLLGYFCVWLVGCAVLFIVALLLVSLTGSQMFAGVVAVAGAVTWRLSGVNAGCLARCQRHVSLNKSGVRGIGESLSQGASHGMWCCTTCWPLMLIALCVPSIHLLVMIASTFIIFYERRPPKTCHVGSQWSDQA